jgi:hypothetical protein
VVGANPMVFGGCFSILDMSSCVSAHINKDRKQLVMADRDGVDSSTKRNILSKALLSFKTTKEMLGRQSIFRTKTETLSRVNERKAHGCIEHIKRQQSLSP